jgi:hypothetical protein
MTASIEDDEPRIVYWHRELPPLEAELVAEHTVEANSSRVPGTIAHRDELWDQLHLIRDTWGQSERQGMKVCWAESHSGRYFVYA